MTIRLSCITLLVPASAALLIGTAPRAAVRVASPQAQFGGFEKSFNDALYKDERLEKNKAIRDAEDALPNLLNSFKADGLALRQGIDELREAGATVSELKRFIEALQKADPTLITPTDEAILSGADQVRELSLPQRAKPPPDTFLTEEQFEAVREVSMSGEACWDENKSGACPEELKSAFSGRPVMFFSLLRNPRGDPTPTVWQAVRNRFPSLQGVPDDELFKNLTECRKEFVDARFL